MRNSSAYSVFNDISSSRSCTSSTESKNISSVSLARYSPVSKPPPDELALLLFRCSRTSTNPLSFDDCTCTHVLASVWPPAKYHPYIRLKKYGVSAELIALFCFRRSRKVVLIHSNSLGVRSLRSSGSALNPEKPCSFTASITSSFNQTRDVALPKMFLSSPILLFSSRRLIRRKMCTISPYNEGGFPSGARNCSCRRANSFAVLPNTTNSPDMRSSEIFSFRSKMRERRTSDLFPPCGRSTLHSCLERCAASTVSLAHLSRKLWTSSSLTAPAGKENEK